jgi:hypothetical protein
MAAATQENLILIIIVLESRLCQEEDLDHLGMLYKALE